MEAQDAPNRPAAGVKNMTLLVKCIGIPIFGIALVLLGYTQLGLLREFIAFCRNEKLVVEQPSKSFGALRPGASAKISYSIKNIGDKPVSIIGVNTQCTCTAVAQGLPFIIPVGTKTDLFFAISHSKRPGFSDELIALYTDCPTQPVISMKLSGNFE